MVMAEEVESEGVSMNKAIRFVIYFAVCTVFVVPLFYLFKSNYPILHEVISLVGGLIVLYMAGRYIWEHFDD